MVEEFLEIQPLIQKAMEAKIGQRQSVPVEMVNSVIEMNPTLGMKLKNEVSKLKFQIIMNQVRTQNDIDIGHSIQSVCKKYFGIQVEFIGHLDYDQSAWQSVKKRRPVVLEFPQSNIASEFKGIVKKLHDH
jgi:flagellar biosynthesis protein FlhG